MSNRSCFLVISSWLQQEPELTRLEILNTAKLGRAHGYAQSTMDSTLRELKEMARGGMTPQDILNYTGRQHWG